MISPFVRSELAPTGKLRIGINYGNPVLATRDPSSGELRGVAVDLAHELGTRSGLPVELVAFESAGKMFEAVENGGGGIGVFAIDPGRAGGNRFSPPFFENEGTDLVSFGSALFTIAGGVCK